ncbi:beta-lactamase family protein [Fulvivirga maritima]|uniref:serine hydrolase domain-containing protein n=1 Tax=Fulvivirga maritima TaxID=2904247 RepID=UPI001F2AC113|nr:serine hydrolase domain-containing protein [Fulvivirga maritima]UII24587.1 beta-lactamase family protein [Fulvivirga maritima]
MKKRKPVYLLVMITIIALSLTFIGMNRRDLSPKPMGEPKKVKESPPELTAYEQDFYDEFAKYVEEKFASTNTPGAAVVIVKDGFPVYKSSFGFKSTNNTDSIGENTLFRLASVSKGFSSILAGLEAKDSLIHWSDHISKYLSGTLPAYCDSITIKNLLSHTSGFQYQAFSTLIEEELPRDTLIKKLLTLQLSRKPGAIHSYQNIAYSIIEPILEKVTGDSFHDLIYKRIFLPLHMNTASISYDSMINYADRAEPHGYRNKSYVPTSLHKSYYNTAAAGGINASINDMTQWLAAVTGNREEVIPHEVLNAVFEPVIQIRVKNPYFSQLYTPREGYYGMGWRIMEYPKDTLIYHNGYANGFKSGIAFDRDKNIGICVLTNAPTKFSNLVLSEFFSRYYEQFNHQEVPNI